MIQISNVLISIGVYPPQIIAVQSFPPMIEGCTFIPNLNGFMHPKPIRRFQALLPESDVYAGVIWECLGYAYTLGRFEYGISRSNHWQKVQWRTGTEKQLHQRWTLNM